MATTTIVNGVLEDALVTPSQASTYFRLKQAGADNDVTPTTVYGRGFVEGSTGRKR